VVNEWVWFVEYKNHQRYLVLAERDSIGTMLVSLGSFFLNRSCGPVLWRVRLDGPVYRLANRLLAASDKHVKVLASAPVNGWLHELLSGSVDLMEFLGG
jgi:hypothetical protein